MLQEPEGFRFRGLVGSAGSDSESRSTYLRRGPKDSVVELNHLVFLAPSRQTDIQYCTCSPEEAWLFMPRVRPKILKPVCFLGGAPRTPAFKPLSRHLCDKSLVLVAERALATTVFWFRVEGLGVLRGGRPGPITQALRL